MKVKVHKRDSIHRMLFLRLAITALVIAILLGLAVFMVEKRKVGRVVLLLAKQGAVDFSHKVRPLLTGNTKEDIKIVQRELDAFMAEPIDQDIGRGVFISIRDATGKEYARFVAPNLMEVNAVEQLITFPDDPGSSNDEQWYETKTINKTSYIKGIEFFPAVQGREPPYLQWIFALSPQIDAAVRKSVTRTVGIAIGIVLVTTILLYPTIMFLMGRVTRLSLKLLDSHLEMLKVLGSAIAKRDSDTDAHNYRVTIIAVRLAEKLGLDRKTIQRLIKGAFLHDVGKLGIPDYILLKPGRLTDEEFETMKKHAKYGLDIVSRSEWLADAKEVVGFHHEKVDASGYLEGLKESEIPVTARIFAIADVFDALSSKRPYKEALSFGETMEILEKGKGMHFDAVFLYAFSHIAKELYDNVTNQGDDEIHKALDMIIEEYYSGDFDLLEP